MFSHLKPIKLPHAESFTLETNLSSKDALTKIQGALVKKTDSIFWELFSVSVFGNATSKFPKFFGEANKNGFEVTLASCKPKNFIPIFSAPKINATFQGHNPVQIQVSMENSKYERVFFLLFSGFALLWWILWLLALPIGLAYGYWEYTQSNQTPSPVNLNFTILLTILGLYLVPIIIVPFLFIILPKFLVNQSWKYSKQSLLDIFELR